MNSLRYNLVDVFTDTPLEGNPLAVFTSARGLNDAQMQGIAREMNLSETVFLFPPNNGGHAHLRIFTPRRELPFAGHPVLGSAWILGQPMEMEVLKLETGAGTIDVSLEREGSLLVGAFMKQPLPNLSTYASSELVWKALGVSGADVEGEITHAENGPQHLLCELPSEEALSSLRPDMGMLAQAWQHGVLAFVYAKGAAVARYFAPGAGINEDPATGSAVGPLGAHLVRAGRHKEGELLEVLQGREIQRPSQLSVQIQVEKGEISEVVVGGQARVIGRGELLPW